ncbi:unnamed protein product [Brachionus calyciflorus]|uniref:C-type lectin domain-containing protein n=1 Tax=Brachionus calyciflorus TaxID=104777 RepID=A0A814BBN2_9BILA|nr:unnamed protein product [Brachionus calyciflorus]
MFEKMNPLECLNLCKSNWYCSFVEIKENFCYLFSEYLGNYLTKSNKKRIYKKVSFRINNDFNCLNINEFMSLSLKKCLKCPPGFKVYSKYSHYCFFELNANYSFPKAKSFCKEIGGYLPIPKSSSERSMLYEIYGSKIFFVDSIITELNEVFKWNDGTKVGGFMVGRPNNFNGNGTLKENVLGLEKGFFNDFPSYLLLSVVCQYN